MKEITEDKQKKRLKKMKIKASYIYEIEIDESNSTVRDYVSEGEMIEDLVHYRFQTLPVIGKGVEIKDIEVNSFRIL